MTREAILFSTYYRTFPIGQMGVFKRCMRMMAHLVDDFDIHFVNYGPMPQFEPVYESIRDRVTMHDSSGPEGPTLHRIMSTVNPRAVILGEAPLRGSMRMAMRVASRLGIWQIGIDNLYDLAIPPHFVNEWPAVDRWLLLGLIEPELAGVRVLPEVAVIPPLVRFPPGFGTLERDRTTILGYDKDSLVTGLDLLRHLPQPKVDFFVSPATRRHLQDQTDIDMTNPGFRVIESPTDAEIYDSLARAQVVVGKAGYQQIVETLLLGAPIVCRACGGGVTWDYVAPPMKPHVRIVNSEWDLRGCLETISGWLASPPVNVWTGIGERIPDAIEFGARTLKALIEESVAGHRPRPPRVIDRPFGQNDFSAEESENYLLFRKYVESRRWTELRRLLEPLPAVWAFDRLFRPAEFVDLLEGWLADAVDLKLLPSVTVKRENYDHSTHITQTCCLVWGEGQTWMEHELDFDLHLGGRQNGGKWKLAYVGITAATPHRTSG